MRHGRHYQNAYVTRDIDATVARFAAQVGRNDIRTFQIATQVTTAKGEGEAVLRLALAWIGELQYEFIQPVSGLVDLYTEALPQDGVRFHHIAARVDDWDGFRAQVARDGAKIAQEGSSGPLRFLYLDMRDLLGHYVEYCATTAEGWARMGAPWAADAGA